MDDQQKAYEVLCQIIQSGFFVTYDKQLEWGYREGVSLQEVSGLTTEDLKPFMSDKQFSNLERKQ